MPNRQRITSFYQELLNKEIGQVFCTIAEQQHSRSTFQIPNSRSFCTKARLTEPRQQCQPAGLYLHAATGPARLAHAQDLPALQLVIFFDICQSLGPQLGSMQSFLQVLALGLGREVALGVLAPCDVLFAFPTEMNSLLDD